MIKKKYDLVVKVGEYTDRDGNKKAEWKNIGVELENQDGGRFILMDRHFNPAGVPNPDNKGNVLISKFEPKQNSQGGGQQKQATRPAPATQPENDYQF